MAHVAIRLLAVAAVQAFCYANVTKLPAEHRKVLQDASRFHGVRATTNLPSTVVKLCTDLNGRIAEPGREWEASDVIRGDKLPRKRLIWAVTDGEHYVVHYERGGIAHSFHILVVSLAKGTTKPTFVWRGVGDQLRGYAAFLSALKTNKLDDRLEYAH